MNYFSPVLLSNRLLLHLPKRDFTCLYDTERLPAAYAYTVHETRAYYATRMTDRNNSNQMFLSSIIIFYPDVKVKLKTGPKRQRRLCRGGYNDINVRAKGIFWH